MGEQQNVNGQNTTFLTWRFGAGREATE